jgi:hypothetical protein
MSIQSPAAPRAAQTPEARVPSLEEQIMEAVRAIRYGSVQITIHDSRVVQIERTEKVRLSDGR